MNSFYIHFIVAYNEKKKISLKAFEKENFQNQLQFLWKALQ